MLPEGESLKRCCQTEGGKFEKALSELPPSELAVDVVDCSFSSGVVQVVR